MREAPGWFNAELGRIGGFNPYGEPVFKVVWSTEPRTVSGGHHSDNYIGYRELCAVPGEPCWVLMVWESREAQGLPWRWESDYRDEETGLLDCGAYPGSGKYRPLQRFIHREVVRQPMEQHWMDAKGEPHIEVLQTLEVKVTRMEPCGFMLDVMTPMLMAWLRLTDVQKIAALKQEEQLQKDEFLKMAKDARTACKISRGSKLVQERAEQIERGMRQAMAMAARTGLGMRVAAA